MRRHGAGGVEFNQLWSPWEKLSRSLHPDHDESLAHQEILRDAVTFLYRRK
jgi:hypothetical protein